MSEKQPQPNQPTLTPQQLMEAFARMIQQAQGNEGWQQELNNFQNTEPKENPYVTKPQEDTKSKKVLKTVKTDTFLDTMFLDENDKEVGLPVGSNMLLSGLPNSGKSLCIREVVLHLANNGVKVCFATSEEVWHTDSDRYDLETRFMDTAKVLGLDWTKIKDNLIILDVVNHAELREWSMFIQTYRELVENKNVSFVAIDSLSMLEDNRGNVKNRLADFCRYNQTKNVTSIVIVQRTTEDSDGMNLAGGLALSHITDILAELDYKRLSSWDGNIKCDTGIAQGQIAFFFRIQKCRLIRYKANYFSYSITSDGLVRLNPKVIKLDQKI